MDLMGKTAFVTGGSGDLGGMIARALAADAADVAISYVGHLAGATTTVDAVRAMGNHCMTKGEVVLVLFPFDDLSATKVRPAVCLTEPIGRHQHVMLALISELRLRTARSRGLPNVGSTLASGRGPFGCKGI
jgi:NAD(P)-dependent dehydrogenase (short-subunit alcohol dehydrogenase family)